jgi:type III pantothenate kinase
LSERLLLIDVGNSRLKWATATTRRMSRAQALAHDGDPAAVLRQQRWPKVSAVWIANVMGSRYERELARAVSRGLSLRACFAHSEAQFAGVRSGYREPERLGVDRWLAVLAAHRRAAGGVCVAMAGTALTLDAVNANGRHLGGMIAPGMSTLQRALLEAVRFRTRAAQPRLRASLGRDTDACVGAGTLFALLGALDRAAAQAGAETRLISGGDAALLIRHLPGWRLVPDLVLEGLWLRAGGGLSPTR